MPAVSVHCLAVAVMTMQITIIAVRAAGAPPSSNITSDRLFHMAATNTRHTHTRLTAFLHDYLGEPVPER